MKKFSYALNALLLTVLLAVGYVVVVRGSVAPSDDGRISIILEPGERQFMLADMRGLLESVQAVAEAAGANDMKAVAEAARKSGFGQHEEAPLAIRLKLPMEMKALGPTMHQSFDDLALAAEQGADAVKIAALLGQTLSVCTACHAGYRYDTPAK